MDVCDGVIGRGGQDDVAPLPFDEFVKTSQVERGFSGQEEAVLLFLAVPLVKTGGGDGEAAEEKACLLYTSWGPAGWSIRI